MSYLQSKANTPGFKECIISFWFRIPGASMAAIPPYDRNADPSPVFNGVLPLLVMGEEGLEEGKYDSNPERALWNTTDFKSDGPFYDYYTEYLPGECLSYHDFTFIYEFHCCLTELRTIRYTPIFEGAGEDYYKEEYRIVYSPEYREQKSNPTCIGVTDDGYLYVNFQTNKQPEITNDTGWEYVTSITPGHTIATSGRQTYWEGDDVWFVTYNGGLLGCVGLIESQVKIASATVHPGVEGAWDYKQPEEHKTSFPILPYETGKFNSGGYEGRFGNNIKVSPDHWHHVLVSVKLQTTKTHNELLVSGKSPQGYEGGSLLYVALDDKNYIKDDLSRMWSWGGSDGKFGPNEVFPDMAWDIATDYYRPGVYEQMTYELPDPEVPAGVLGLPASGKYVKNIQQVEMAELQIWFGQSFDTKDVSKRRLFIDSKGKPTKPEKAEEALGKPDILLHGSGKWKNGVNTGKLASISAGTGETLSWFEPTPKDGIVRWKPDPSLHGPQNKGEKEPAAPQGET